MNTDKQHGGEAAPTQVPIRITPDNKPYLGFPGWLWSSHTKSWWRRDVFPDAAPADEYTHWLPDLPTAPTCRPDETTGGPLRPLPGTTFEPPPSPDAGTPTPSEMLEWLHTGCEKDPEGYEWGIYRVKNGTNGQPISVLHTLSDLSDLRAEMSRVKSANSVAHIKPSPTPRTDEQDNPDAFLRAHVVPADFARTLERELAEANARVENLRESYLSWATKWEAAQTELAALRTLLATAEKERDEVATAMSGWMETAQRRANELTRIIDRCDGYITQTKETDGPAERKVADMQAVLARLTAPLDEKKVEECAQEICDIENICIGGDYSDMTAKAVQPDKIVAIIRRHFTTPTQ